MLHAAQVHSIPMIMDADLEICPGYITSPSRLVTVTHNSHGPRILQSESSMKIEDGQIILLLRFFE